VEQSQELMNARAESEAHTNLCPSQACLWGLAILADESICDKKCMTQPVLTPLEIERAIHLFEGIASCLTPILFDFMES
jgi:hypothetical protein